MGHVLPFFEWIPNIYILSNDLGVSQHACFDSVRGCAITKILDDFLPLDNANRSHAVPVEEEPV